MAILSSGIKVTRNSTLLTNLIEISEIATPAAEEIEVTTLADTHHKYMEGLKGAPEAITMKFYYESNQFSELFAQVGKNTDNGEIWMIELPDTSKFDFDGYIESCTLDSATTNAAMTYSIAVKPCAATTIHYTAAL